MPPSVSPFQHIPQLQHPQQQQQQQQQQNQQNATFYPALHLYPLNDSFVPKQISLAPQHGRVKIGRQTNAKTVPGERNGYFDSKVLSRQHAEIWEEGGKIYIKDVKSSNGTFINGERLSQEGIESEPFELKTDDTVEFGIDIVGEDNKTIIHHKVAAKVVVVLTPDDLANLPMHHQANNRRSMGGQMQGNPVQNSALGGMGGAPRQGRGGLTFEHILSKLQTELAKSRETGSELNQLTGAMADIQDTLGGALPPTLPTYPAVLPAVRPLPIDQPAPQRASSASPDNSTLNTIQSQLQDTQSNLQQHLDKIRHLESYVNDQEALKREVGLIRDQMEERKREVEILLMQRRREDDDRNHFSRRRNTDGMDDDDDDARSVATAMPDRGSDDEEGDEERRRRTEELGRPRTPEPTGHLLDEEYEEERRAAQSQSQAYAQPESSVTSSSVPQSSPNGHVSPPHVDLSAIYSQNAALSNRLETLTAQLDSAIELSRSLQTQATMAQSTIAILEAKVGNLEAFVTEHKEKAVSVSPLIEPTASVTPADPETPLLGENVADAPPAPETVEVEAVVAKGVWEEWREHVEGEWKSERETWVSERERLAGAVREWEIRTAELERKEDERNQREEAAALAARNRRSAGFDDSSSGEEGDGSSESFQSDGRMPAMINGFSPKKGGRRRKSHGNGMANGGATLPSPHSSPTSSSSFYPPHAHTRRSTSPTSEEPESSSHFMTNGKLPISPPNTSPRSRAESLAPPPNEDGEQSPSGEEHKAENGGGRLGLIDGSMISPSCHIAAMNGSNGQQVPNSFTDSAMSFAERNGLGPNGPSFKQQVGELPLFHLTAASAVIIGLTAWAVVNRDRL